MAQQRQSGQRRFHTGSPGKINRLVCIVPELAGGGSMTVALAVAVPVAVAVFVALGFNSYGASIRTHQKIEFSPV